MKNIESLQVYKHLFDMESDAVFLVDNGTMEFLDANRAATRLYGYSRDEFLRMKGPDVSAEPDATRSAVESQARHVSIRWHRRKDGTVFPVEIAGSYFDLGRRRVHVAAIRDISERMASETALRTSEAKARALIDIPVAAVFVIDRNGICIDANETLARRLQRKREELIGGRIWDFFPPDVAVRRKRHFETLLVEKRQARFEDERAGMWNESIITPVLDAAGEVERVLVVGFDITERKKMEQVLADSEHKLYQKTVELEEMNSALKVLLKQGEEDRLNMARDVSANIEQLVMPYIDRLKGAASREAMSHLKILESNLRNVISSFSSSLTHRDVRLTPQELLVANLVREGRQDKDIAGTLGLSVHTIKAHRRAIRRKLGLTGDKANLRVFLSTMQ